jgi:hypothetical protein
MALEEEPVITLDDPENARSRGWSRSGWSGDLLMRYKKKPEF